MDHVSVVNVARRRGRAWGGAGAGPGLEQVTFLGRCAEAVREPGSERRGVHGPATVPELPHGCPGSSHERKYRVTFGAPLNDSGVRDARYLNRGLLTMNDTSGVGT